jgi:hypothetical protein
MAYRTRIGNIVAAAILYAAYNLVNHSTYVPTNKISSIVIYDLHGSFVIVMADYCNPL